MSKKELLERLSRPPADVKVRRAEVPVVPTPAAVAPTGDAAVTTRVSGNVVRRRQRNEPGGEAPVIAEPVVARRRAVEVTPPELRPSEPIRTRMVDNSRPSRSAEHPPRVEFEPAKEAAEAYEAEFQDVDAGFEADDARFEHQSEESVSRDVPPEASESVREPSTDLSPDPMPTVEATAPSVEEAKPEPRAARPPEAPRTDAPRSAGSPPRTEAQRPGSQATTPRTEARAEGVPTRARFEGLGRAVVALPPGYDPTNPVSRRRPAPTPPPSQPRNRGPGQQGQQGAHPPRNAGGNFGPGRGPGPAANQNTPQTPAPVSSDDFRRRFDAPAPPSAEDDRRGRRSRRPAMPEPAMNRGRPRRKPSAALQKASPGPKASKRKIRVDNVVSVGQLAHELGVKASVVIKQLMGLGRMATVNEMLDMDTASLIAGEFDYEVVNAGFQEGNFLQHVTADVEEVGLQSRPPVVTIMGHVDHGKTTLLDAVRSAKVAAGEAGGITQHIGAYQVELDGNRITFIDTPGHAAFTAMRARGAGVTDIVILVVAADDGVQAQTEEAIAHAKAAGVPIIVAINKMDKPGVSADPIKNRLGEYGLVPEDWGGDTMFVQVSALKRQGIDDLLEAILLQAEVLDLKANPDRHAEGVVIEARVERGRGAVATLLVQKGTLKRGDNVVLGASWGRVRAMNDHTGKQLKEAAPSTPIEIFGLSEVPGVGEPFHVVKNDKDARTIAEHRSKEKREQGLIHTGRRTAADIFAQAEAAEKKTLNLILKSDVQGSLEALRTALLQIQVNGTELRLLHSAVGDISESDINLAAANHALLIGFSVKVDAMARQAAESQGITPEMFDIIYGVLDRVTALMSGLLGPQYREVRQGSTEIRAIYNVSKSGKIAGCHVLDGKISRNATVRLMRRGDKIWEGRIKTLKRFKDDAREVASGYDCGVGLEGFDVIEVGDILESFIQEQITV